MRILTASQWNFLWSRGNGGCIYQGTLERSEQCFRELKSLAQRCSEVVRIVADGFPDMFGVVSTQRVSDILEGRI